MQIIFTLNCPRCVSFVFWLANVIKIFIIVKADSSRPRDEMQNKYISVSTNKTDERTDLNICFTFYNVLKHLTAVIFMHIQFALKLDIYC